jgi:hypothetical protein
VTLGSLVDGTDFSDRRDAVLVGKHKEKCPLARPRHRWEDNIKMDLQEMELGHGLD